MVNKVLDAITVALHKKFKDGYHYYVEDVRQELKTPCFTVDMINPMERSVNAKHYYRTMPVVIHYFSDDEKDLKKDGYSIGERALMALEYIIIDNRLYRGEGMEMSFVDDVLQMFITYRFWTEVPEEPNYMDDLENMVFRS